MSTYPPPVPKVPAKDEMERRLSAVTYQLDQRVVYVFHLLNQFQPFVNAVENLEKEKRVLERRLEVANERIEVLTKLVREHEARPAVPTPPIELPTSVGSLERGLYQALASRV